jgi:metallo-beta-lactamase family protein
MGVNITFLGGADTVTGSKYLVHHDGHNLLLDCGLFQGYKQLRLRNRTPLPIAPDANDAVVLTHAHLDHSGYLPLLVKEGFSGKVYATKGTQALCKILLPDSGHIQEEDAAFANRHGFSKHSPALPLYTRQDALDCLPLIKAVDMDKTFQPLPRWRVTFSPAGHTSWGPPVCCWRRRANAFCSRAIWAARTTPSCTHQQPHLQPTRS